MTLYLLLSHSSVIYVFLLYTIIVMKPQDPYTSFAVNEMTESKSSPGNSSTGLCQVLISNI